MHYIRINDARAHKVILNIFTVIRNKKFAAKNYRKSKSKILKICISSAVLVKDKTGVQVSLVAIIVITFIYLHFVLVSGPIFMRKREPFNVKFWIRLYNIFQIIVCGIYVVRGYMLGFDFTRICRCDRFEFLTENQKLELFVGIWSFLGLRLLEYVETVFFILRKKYKQASFLHIFHHIGSVAMVWIWLNVEAGEKI